MRVQEKVASQDHSLQMSRKRTEQKIQTRESQDRKLADRPN